MKSRRNIGRFVVALSATRPLKHFLFETKVKLTCKNACTTVLLAAIIYGLLSGVIM